jgi:hypothetical protein
MLVLVGASLLANRGDQRALPQANIRRQASAYKDKLPLAVNGLLYLPL